MIDHKQWVSEVFDRAAPQYGKKSSSFFSYFGKRLVEQVDIKPHDQILDIATGRGAVLFPLLEITGKITGIDISQQMLHETSAELLEKGIDHVDLLHMDAENLDFPDNSFDFVFCGFALFFFPSVLKALAEFKRVLKQGGRLVVSTWGSDSELDKLINNEINNIAPTMSLAATPIWSGLELQNILEKADFHNVQIREESKKFVHETAEAWWNSLWAHGTRSKFEQLSAEQLMCVHNNALKTAAQYVQEQGLEEKLQVFYGIAHK
jgi:ubiquinone/menaquinone biosynthesis C-methylase UbiE